MNAQPIGMSFDGEVGYFLTMEEYDYLRAKATGQEQSDYTKDLEIENQNLRNAITEAYAGLTTIRYDLGNA